MAKELRARLHPHLTKWFFANYRDFTDAQLLCVPSILEHESILLTSPTGSGKTLAGFLGVFDFLLRKIDAGTLTSSVQCIYVSPLRVLEQHEPQHPLLNETYRQAMHIFLDAEEAYASLDRVQSYRWMLRELEVISPFSFGIYASKIKESMMLEDTGAALERIYADLYARVESVAERK